MLVRRAPLRRCCAPCSPHDAALSGLEVRAAALEDAFLALTNNTTAVVR